jgi:single-strand DNA-binding protein
LTRKESTLNKKSGYLYPPIEKVDTSIHFFKIFFKGEKMSYNKVTLMGRICNDLEVKLTANSVPYLNFNLAVDREYKDKNGDYITDFFHIIAWRNTAEFIKTYFKKGNMLLIDGQAQVREYVDRDNIARRVYEIVVERAHFTGERNKIAEEFDENPETGISMSDLQPEDIPDIPDDLF